MIYAYTVCNSHRTDTPTLDLEVADMVAHPEAMEAATEVFMVVEEALAVDLFPEVALEGALQVEEAVILVLMVMAVHLHTQLSIYHLPSQVSRSLSKISPGLLPTKTW